jgi:hypothetical protein
MRGPWIAWILACTLLPALPFLLIGKRGLDDGGAMIPIAILCQFGFSIWLAIRLAAKLKKSPGFAVLLTVVFMIVSIIIGTMSLFTACVTLGGPMNFH